MVEKSPRIIYEWRFLGHENTREEEPQEEEMNYEFIKRIKETSPSALKLFLILS